MCKMHRDVLICGPFWRVLIRRARRHEKAESQKSDHGVGRVTFCSRAAGGRQTWLSAFSFEGRKWGMPPLSLWSEDVGKVVHFAGSAVRGDGRARYSTHEEGRGGRRGDPLAASQVWHLPAPHAALCPRARLPALLAAHNGGRAKHRCAWHRCAWHRCAAWTSLTSSLPPFISQMLRALDREPPSCLSPLSLAALSVLAVGNGWRCGERPADSLARPAASFR